MGQQPELVKIATVYEITSGEMKGKYVICPATEDDLPEVFLKINQASASALKKLLDMLRLPPGMLIAELEEEQERKAWQVSEQRESEMIEQAERDRQAEESKPVSHSVPPVKGQEANLVYIEEPRKEE